MLVEKTGPRYDGRFWPGPGGEIDVPDDEGKALCAQGDARPVARKDADVETRAGAQAQPAPQAPETAAQPMAAKPAVNDPKDAWVAYAAAQGAKREDAEAMSKTQLIKQYGG